MLPHLGRRLRRYVRWYWLRERALVIATWLAVRVLPARPVAVVHGFPNWEGNAVEVVRGLVRRYPGTICWIYNDAPPHEELARLGAPAGKVVTAKVNSLAAFRATWQAEAVFFTHGMITAVRPPRSRLVVNLWHGDGPKLTDVLPRCASTVAVATTELWGREKQRMFGLRSQDVAVVGHPRLDSAADRPASQTRELLGLARAGERVVLWMPTYRRGHDGGVHSWADGDPLSSTLGGVIRVPDGVQLLVKPHPMDTDDYSALGATVLTNDDLARTGVTLVQLLAAADAVISDASSAWVDYLTFDRPVGFFLPDLDLYADKRGYNVPDLFAVLPGPVLRTPAEVSDFLVEVRDGRVGAPSTYTSEYAAIGYRAELPVTDHLFAWLDDYQRARGERALFAAATGGGR